MSLLRKISLRHIHKRPSLLCRRIPAARPPPDRRLTMSSTTTTTTTTVTAAAMTGPEILRLFPEVNPALVNATPTAGAAGDDALEGYDEEQVRLMDEVCIVIDNDDKPVGSASKKICAWFSPVCLLATHARGLSLAPGRNSACALDG